MSQSVFEVLNAINVNGHTEEKNGLTYLSWAWAWAEVKKAYPQAFYTIYENADGWNYFTNGRTCWVKTGVTIEGLEHIEDLPVMDYNNRSIPADKVTSFDVNKAIQRSLTKACARHGLGLYIYAGEDLPDAADDSDREALKAPAPKKASKKQAPAQQAPVRKITQESWDRLVAAAAMGKELADGTTPRGYYQTFFNPDAARLEFFDRAVEDYKLKNGL